MGNQATSVLVLAFSSSFNSSSPPSSSSSSTNSFRKAMVLDPASTCLLPPTFVSLVGRPSPLPLSTLAVVWRFHSCTLPPLVHMTWRRSCTARGLLEGEAPNIMGLFLTIVIFAIVIYPIKLFYVSNMPIMLRSTWTPNLFIVSQMFASLSPATSLLRFWYFGGMLAIYIYKRLQSWPFLLIFSLLNILLSLSELLIDRHWGAFLCQEVVSHPSQGTVMNLRIYQVAVGRTTLSSPQHEPARSPGYLTCTSWVPMSFHEQSRDTFPPVYSHCPCSTPAIYNVFQGKFHCMYLFMNAPDFFFFFFGWQRSSLG